MGRQQPSEGAIWSEAERGRFFVALLPESEVAGGENNALSRSLHCIVVVVVGMSRKVLHCRWARGRQTGGAEEVQVVVVGDCLRAGH